VWFFGTSDGSMSLLGLIPIAAVYSGFVMWGVKTFGERSWGDAIVGVLAYLLSYALALSAGALVGFVGALVTSLAR
jgi:hypothetical protein